MSTARSFLFQIFCLVGFLFWSSAWSATGPAGVQSIDACFKSGHQTVQSMYACSGKWVSPRAFMFCNVEAGCPTYADTVAGRASLLATLGPDGLNTKLTLNPDNLPKLPTAKEITDCRRPGITQKDFEICVLSAMGSVNSDALLTCGKQTDPQHKADCLAKLVPDLNVQKMTACMSGKAPTPENIGLCLGVANVGAQMADAKKCLSASGGSLAKCTLPGLPADQAAILNCLSGAGGNAKKAAECAFSSNPASAAAYKDVACATRARNSAEAAACLAPHLGGDAGKVAGCVAGPRDAIVGCLVGNRPEYRAAQQVYSCASGGRDAGALIENCSGGIIKDEKTRETLACAARAGSDRSALASCAAGAVLPPEVARYTSCAATSQGATSFALCAAGPKMNEEWRIAAECAVETGGNPVGFAGCTAGRLTVRELTKCLTGQLGKDCFGPNNTICKTLENAFNDLTKGPGKNNEIVKALVAIGQVTGGPNSVINNPGQLLGGPNSILHNPGQIAGGPNSFINNPGQIAGGSNSVINNPGQIGGGPNSMIRNPGQITGGHNSEVNKVLRAFHF